MKKYSAIAVLIIILGVLGWSISRPPQVAAPSLSRSGSDNIRVSSPLPYETIGNPLVIKGEARVFENAFNYRLLDSAGAQIAGGFDSAEAEDIGLHGSFEVSVAYQKPVSGDGFVEVYTHSAEDGSEIDLVRIPIKF